MKTFLKTMMGAAYSLAVVMVGTGDMVETMAAVMKECQAGMTTPAIHPGCGAHCAFAVLSSLFITCSLQITRLLRKLLALLHLRMHCTLLLRMGHGNAFLHREVPFKGFVWMKGLGWRALALTVSLDSVNSPKLSTFCGCTSQQLKHGIYCAILYVD